jgi:cobalt-zinc-cadmium efflux system outer membrane protein
MNLSSRVTTVTRYLVLVLLLVLLNCNASFLFGQSIDAVTSEASRSADDPSIWQSGKNFPTSLSSESIATRSSTALYFDLQEGTSSGEIVRRALLSNGELSAARLEIERARARLRQAGLRPNPTLEFELTTGRLTGSAGESATSVGLALPLEINGIRGSRIQLAQAELEAAEAEVAERERRLSVDVLSLYATALSSLREMVVIEGIRELDLKTVAFVQTRVNEGETAPIELNLLRVEVDRLRSRQALVEGRLQSTLLQLKTLAGLPLNEPLRLRDQLTSPSLAMPPSSLESAIAIALRTRPDLRFARLNEEAAQARLRLARAQARPDVTAFGRFDTDRSVLDDTPVGTFFDNGKSLTFGATIGIPVFNRNQGSKVEAAVAISQARMRRVFLETIVRSEVQSAYLRFEAANAALLTFQQGVIDRSNENIRTIRAAYELGQFSIADLLAEQRRLVDSQREFTETLSERYRALTDLNAAIGAVAIQSNTQK